MSAGEGREEGISCDFPPSSGFFFSQKTVVGSHYMLSITAFGSADGAPLSSSVQPGAGYHPSFFWLFNDRRLSSPKAQQQTGGMLPTTTTVLLKSGGSSLTALWQKAAATVLSFPCQRAHPLVQRVRPPPRTNSHDELMDLQRQGCLQRAAPGPCPHLLSLGTGYEDLALFIK